MTAGQKAMLTALLAGAIFGAGLGLSGLANPDKVLAFLTLGESWDPALLFTMAAAVLVTFIGYRFVLRRGPVFADDHALPTKTRLDRRLLTGAAVFGLGWGLAGFCPGPAITSMASGMLEPFVFIAAMVAGAQLEPFLSRPEHVTGG